MQGVEMGVILDVYLGTLWINGSVISSMCPHTPEGTWRCMGRPKLAARVRRLSIRLLIGPKARSMSSLVPLELRRNPSAE